MFRFYQEAGVNNLKTQKYSFAHCKEMNFYQAYINIVPVTVSIHSMRMIIRKIFFYFYAA